MYDIGANNGDDAAYYLFKGYRVLAIEADPTLMPSLQERFAAEIEKGRLTLLNIALAPERKRAPFWICEGYSLWNSFEREVASRMGRNHYSVELDCWPLRDVFAKYGVPYYLKLSLHGHEHFCLVDIQAEVSPAYLSLELPVNVATSEEIVTRMSNIGYDRYKIINQATLKQLKISPPTLKSRMRQILQRHPPLYDYYESISDWGRRLLAPGRQAPIADDSNQRESRGGWVFPVGSSGPFGEETNGPWRRSNEIRADWNAFVSGETDQGPPNLSIWHDLHATRMTSTEISR